MLRYLLTLSLGFFLSCLLCSAQVKPKMDRTRATTPARTVTPKKTHRNSARVSNGRTPKPQAQSSAPPSAPVQQQPPATTLDVTADVTFFATEGGNTVISVISNCDWGYTVDKSSWIKLEKQHSTLWVSVEPNMTPQARSCTLTFQAGDKQQQVTISQAAMEVSACINKVWIEHNNNSRGIPGMLIHTNYTVSGMKGHTVYCCLEFYDGNHSARLTDTSGQPFQVFYSDRASYAINTWGDRGIFVPYSALNMPQKSKGVRLCFDVVIRDDHNSVLAHLTRNYFHFDNTKKARKGGRMSW